MPQHVNDQLGDKIPYILAGGPYSIGLESTIVGFLQDTPLVYRLEGISIEDIEQVIGPIEIADEATYPKAPGRLTHHYAPSKSLRIGHIPLLIARYRHFRLGILTFDRYYEGIDLRHQVILTPHVRLEEAAQNLFSTLRRLDCMPIDLILATHVPHVGLGRTINEYLSGAVRVTNDLVASPYQRLEFVC